MSDYIQTSHEEVYVPWVKRRELRRRLEAAGLTDAEQELRTRRSFAESRKADVLHVLEVWRVQVGADEFGPELDNLRRELRRDVSDE